LKIRKRPGNFPYMAIANVDPDTPLAAILARNSFILGELASHPLAAAYIPQFDAIQSTWFTTFTARTALEIAVDKAQGGVEGADDGLDDFVDILDRTLLIAVKNDRDAGLYTMFFEQPAPTAPLTVATAAARWVRVEALRPPRSGTPSRAPGR